ncbi:unnamed protein product [Didymodactylos carnosus]|uniref:Uncharacterized protein n=1 Tax=Didymodactylos carnosus TaxID=1234261 RepID=A0A8S2ZU16_9BILA|nr:unnamed protein product [Didymodactylos carnosus]
MLSFAETEKSKPVLNLNGYRFTKKRSNRKSNQWRWRDRNCTSVISLCSQDLVITKDETQHSCRQDKRKIIIGITVVTMRKGARDEVIPFPSMVQFPSLSQIDASLYRRRGLNYPKLPQSVAEIDWSGAWKLDLNGQ